MRHSVQLVAAVTCAAAAIAIVPSDANYDSARGIKCIKTIQMLCTNSACLKRRLNILKARASQQSIAILIFQLTPMAL